MSVILHKVPVEIERQFKATAYLEGCEQSELFVKLWEAYLNQQNHGPVISVDRTPVERGRAVESKGHIDETSCGQ